MAGPVKIASLNQEDKSPSRFPASYLGAPSCGCSRFWLVEGGAVHVSIHAAVQAPCAGCSALRQRDSTQGDEPAAGCCTAFVHGAQPTFLTWLRSKSAKPLSASSTVGLCLEHNVREDLT